jgi:fructan beta-fructosidase
MRAIGFYFLVSLVALAAGKTLFAQDILLSDFEESNYVWLPGGTWTVTGTAFGTGPAHGALSGQGVVTGYLGGGFANSYNGGDGGTGTLLSPTFTIQRNYIKFLIGGGSYRGEGGYGGETRIDLLVNGQVVQHAAGPGEWENLDWEQWDVSNLLGQTAQIRIVDTATAAWGHVNVDQIVESDASLTTGVIVPTNQFINFPVKLNNPYHVVALLVNGLAVQEFNIALGTASNYDFYAFLDLSAYQNTQMVVRVDSTNGVQLSDFIQSNAPVTSTPFYQETLRPIYHYSARRGFVNDPNGLVYYNGQYHLCYQHNPYDVVVGNQNWGNAVSTDLVHWQELPEAIYGDALGQAWSGSSVVDWNNSAGFGSNAIVSFYTSAGGHSNNNLMSQGQLFGQSMAYSLDQGQTWTKYTNNPVVPNVEGDNRDPKVIWYAPGNKWVMVFWLQNNDFGFFSSTDLKHWTQTSTFTFPNVIEVPELFQLPLDGNANNQPWIFYAGAGNYYVGTFDGNAFTAQNGPFLIRGGNSFAAGQTFNNIPASDGRRILIANGTQNYPNMPFQCAMDFPVELTLNTVSGIPQMFVNPARELSGLFTSTNTWSVQTLASGVNVMSGTTGEAFDLDATFQPGTATSITFTLRGNTVTYNCGAQTVTCAGTTQSLAPSNGMVRLQMLVDRGIIEIYGNSGLLYMPMTVTATSGAQAVSLVATGSGATLNSMVMHNLGSAWNYTNSPTTNPPAITAQPTSITNFPGSTAAFTVTATGASLLAYLWYFNSQPLNTAVNIASVNNSTLTISPSYLTNAGTYDVVIANSFGSVTSSPVTLSYLAPVITAQPVSVTNYPGFPVSFSVTASGAMGYLWYFNGQPLNPAVNIASVTNSNLIISPAYPANTGNYFVIITNASGSVTSSVVALTLSAPYQVAYWRMESKITAPNNAGTPTFAGVADADTNSGQGIFTTGTLPPAIDDLIMFNGLSGNPVSLSTNVAPASMFVNGHGSGNYSYNAEAITNVDGALFFPQDQYGDEMDFTGPFSIEMFFKTDGDQNGAGLMQLISQGTDTGQIFRYGINVNELAPGGIRFKLANSSLAQTNVVDLSGANYADGQWHYLLAVCDTLGGSNGQMRLTIANQDGSQASATNNLPAGFLPLPTGNDGNAFVGRYNYPDAADGGLPRTFLGFIDEVQVTAGVVPDTWRIGKVPSIDNYPQINGVSAGINGVSFQWTGAAANNFLVQWVPQLGAVWATIATQPSANSVASFVDTNASRLTNMAGFYRILSQ